MRHGSLPVGFAQTLRQDRQHSALIILSAAFDWGGNDDPTQDTRRFGNLKTRAEILQALKESYDYGTKVWAGINEQKALEMVTTFRNNQVPRWQPVLANIVDNMDHYGNLVVYVRLNGMVPPRTVARQQPPPTQR